MKEELLSLRQEMQEAYRQARNKQEGEKILTEIKYFNEKINNLTEQDLKERVSDMQSLSKEIEKSKERIKSSIDRSKKMKENFEKVDEILDTIVEAVDNCLSFL